MKKNLLGLLVVLLLATMLVGCTTSKYDEEFAECDGYIEDLYNDIDKIEANGEMDATFISSLRNSVDTLKLSLKAAKINQTKATAEEMEIFFDTFKLSYQSIKNSLNNYLEM